MVGVVDVAAVPQSPLTPRRARHPLLTAVPCQTCHSQRARGERAGEVAPSAQPSWCRLGALDTLGNISPARRRRRRSRRGGEGNTSGSFGRERRMQKRRLLPEVLVVLLDSSIKQCIAAAGGCQEGKFGTDRCSQGGGGGGGGGGGEHHLPPPAKKSGQRIQFWHCQPSDFSSPLLPVNFIYLGGFIQSGLVSCPARSNEPCLGADLSRSTKYPPVVAKAPSQCGQSFKSGSTTNFPT